MDYFKYLFRCTVRYIARHPKILLLIFIYSLVICFLLIAPHVYGASDFVLDGTFFSDDNISRAQQIVGDTWNNENYDIFMSFKVGWGYAGEKSVVTFDVSQCNENSYYLLNGADTHKQTSREGTQYFVYDTRLCVDNGSNTITNYLNRSLTSDYRDQTASLSGSQMGLVQSCAYDNQPYNVLVLPIRTHFPIKDSDGNIVAPKTIQQDPYIVNPSSEIISWDFNYFTISGGEINPTYMSTQGWRTISTTLYYDYNGITYNQNVSAYIRKFRNINNEERFTIEIPRTSLASSINLRDGETISFTLVIDYPYAPLISLRYILGEYTISLTPTQQENINSDTQTETLSNIDKNQQETNQKLDDLNNNITNSNVDDMSSDFSNLGEGFNVTDNTGIDGIFQLLYNSFCEDDIIPLTFTIPFTDSQVTIDPQTISVNFPEALRSIVSIFVWGVIGLWVLKDIRGMIDKMSEGSPEEVGSDVKREVL